MVPRVHCDSLQTRDSGSGDHTPSTVQTAVMVSAGLKPESHWNITRSPTEYVWPSLVATEPFGGDGGGSHDVTAEDMVGGSQH